MYKILYGKYFSKINLSKFIKQLLAIISKGYFWIKYLKIYKIRENTNNNNDILLKKT